MKNLTTRQGGATVKLREREDAPIRLLIRLVGIEDVECGSPLMIQATGVLVSGIKPSGEPHLGNLVGMMLPAVEQARGGDAFLFVADLHAMTTVHDPERLRRHVHDVTAALLATGVEPQRAVLFRQSEVPEILELAWALACLTPVGMLERAHAFKAARSRDVSPTLGLFSYPVLMAADILAFRGERVPVGTDQEQHVEIARDLARRFNQAFGDVFPLPQPTFAGEDAEPLPGLDGNKMSKRYGNTIPIAATDAERRRLVRKIVTDSSPADAPKDTAGAPVVELFRRFASPAEVDALETRLRRGDASWLDAKNTLGDILEREVGPVHRRFVELRRDESRLDAILAGGAERARARARDTLLEVRDRTGLGAPQRPSSSRNQEDSLDDALRMTFPASDPIALRSPHETRSTNGRSSET